MKTGHGINIRKHEVVRANGERVTFDEWTGQVLMLVNVASKCGLTPQYKQLVDIHNKYADRGFKVLGLPANNFMDQEPGSDADIQSFCSTTYGVDFDVLSKISVAGDDQHPLYADLTSHDNDPMGGEIEWNFAKFIINKHGDVVARIHPKMLPDDPIVIACIEAELNAS